MTMASDDTREDEQEAGFLRRIDRLEQAINAMIGAAYLRDPGEAICALIHCIDNVVRSIECADCRNNLVETATSHFNGTIEAIKQEPASDSGQAPSGHVH
jgi:hypothetical protein